MPQESSLSVMLARVYPESRGLTALGKRYLEHSQSTLSASLQRLRSQAQITHAAETGCQTETVSAIEQACRDDFRSGRIVVIDGWVWARTELDIAAFFTVA